MKKVLLFGGLAIALYFLFKKKKVDVSKNQLSELEGKEKKLNEIIDKRFSEQGQLKIELDKIKQDNWNVLNVPLTPTQIAEMEKKGYKGSNINAIMYQFMNMDLRNI
jgi:hypothetical protein